MKNVKFIIVAFCILLFIPACGSSSRTSVDPWPGLFRLKETNKKGYKKEKRRNKRLKKIKKKRLKTLNYQDFQKYDEHRLT